MAKYLDKTLFVLLLFLSTRIVDNLGKSMKGSNGNDKMLGNRVEGMSRIIRNLTQEVQSVKKRVIRVEKEQKEKKADILLQQLKTRVDKIDFHLQLINQTVNYESNQMCERINEAAIGGDQLNFSMDTLKVEVGSLKQQLLERDETFESANDIIYNHFYTQKFEPRIFEYSVYKWIIADVKKKVAMGAFDVESEVFPLKGYSFQAKTKLRLFNDKNYIYMWLSFLDNNGTNNPVELTVIPQVFFILKDVSKNKEQLEHIIESSNYLVNDSLNYNEFYFLSLLSLKSQIIDKNYNINDTAEILVLVEPPVVSQKLRSTDGVILQRVSNYKHKLLLDKKAHFIGQQSSYFSTHPNGYRVQVKMALDGFGDFIGVGVTVRISFLKGEFDSTLSSSFPHKTTVTLFNQRDLTNHLVKSFVGDIKEQKSYKISMATHKQVEEDGYLHNDSLIYQVVIQPIEINQS